METESAQKDKKRDFTSLVKNENSRIITCRKESEATKIKNGEKIIEKENKLFYSNTEILL